jgi:hypothetical protein
MPPHVQIALSIEIEYQYHAALVPLFERSTSAAWFNAHWFHISIPELWHLFRHFIQSEK